LGVRRWWQPSKGNHFETSNIRTPGYAKPSPMVARAVERRRNVPSKDGDVREEERRFVVEVASRHRPVILSIVWKQEVWDLGFLLFLDPVFFESSCDSQHCVKTGSRRGGEANKTLSPKQDLTEEEKQTKP